MLPTACMYKASLSQYLELWTLENNGQTRNAVLSTPPPTFLYPINTYCFNYVIYSFKPAEILVVCPYMNLYTLKTTSHTHYW